jgi:hypothetical protein
MSFSLTVLSILTPPRILFLYLIIVYFRNIENQLHIPFIAQKSLGNVLTLGTHASTFGGTPLACAAGIAVIILKPIK